MTHSNTVDKRSKLLSTLSTTMTNYRSSTKRNIAKRSLIIPFPVWAEEFKHPGEEKYNLISAFSFSSQKFQLLSNTLIPLPTHFFSQ